MFFLKKNRCPYKLEKNNPGSGKLFGAKKGLLPLFGDASGGKKSFLDGQLAGFWFYEFIGEPADGCPWSLHRE